MRLTNYERETIINFNEGEDTASVYTHNSTLRRRLERLAQDRPEECRLVKTCHDGQAVEYYFPKKWLRVNPGLRLTDEQRAAKAEAARKAFSARKSTMMTEGDDTPPAGKGIYTSQPMPPSERGVRAGEEAHR